MCNLSYRLLLLVSICYCNTNAMLKNYFIDSSKPNEVVCQQLVERVSEFFSKLQLGSESSDLKDASLDFKSPTIDKKIDAFASILVSFVGIRFSRRISESIDLYKPELKMSSFYNFFHFVYLNKNTWNSQGVLPERALIDDSVLDRSDPAKIIKFSDFINLFEYNCGKYPGLTVRARVSERFDLMLMVLFFRIVRSTKFREKVKYLICCDEKSRAVFYFDPLDGSLAGYIDLARGMNAPVFFDSYNMLHNREEIISGHKQKCAPILKKINICLIGYELY
jgi:hypothetical protein